MGFCALVGPTLGSSITLLLCAAAWGCTSLVTPQVLLLGGLGTHIHLSHLEKTLLTKPPSLPVHPVAFLD